MEKIIYEGFGDELYEKDKELQTQKQENEKVKQENKKLSKTNKKYKNKIHQLTQMEDLNTPEAKKIINSLMLL